MANMTGAERAQVERHDLGDIPDRLKMPTARERRALHVITVVAIIVLAVLTYAALQVFEGWAHLVVIADLVIVFFGIAAWVYPGRTHA